MHQPQALVEQGKIRYLLHSKVKFKDSYLFYRWCTNSPRLSGAPPPPGNGSLEFFCSLFAFVSYSLTISSPPPPPIQPIRNPVDASGTPRLPSLIPINNIKHQSPASARAGLSVNNIKHQSPAPACQSDYLSACLSVSQSLSLFVCLSVCLNE